MKVSENPYVTQLAIARPNPYQPISSPNSKEGRDMLRRRNPTVSSNSNSSGSSSSISSAEAMQKRRNLQAAIAMIDSNVSRSSSPYGKSYSLEEDVELFENPRKHSAKKAAAKKASPVKRVAKAAAKKASPVKRVAKKATKNPASGVRTNAKRKTKASDALTKRTSATVDTKRTGGLTSRSGRLRGAKKELFAVTSTEGQQKLDLSKVNILAKQVRALKREYAVSKSPVAKKRLDKAVKTLDRMSALVDKDIQRLEKASAILKENPKKGGTMAKAKKATARKRKTSGSIFSKLMTKVQAKKKTASKKRKARKNPGIKALGSAIVGIDNPRKKSGATKRKAKTTAVARKRRSAVKSRRNPGIKALGTAIVGIDNPRKKSSGRKRMSRAVLSALTDFSPTHVVITRNGKAHKLKAQVSSAEYKAAKSKGLTGRFASLKGKKNALDCLSVRSVKSLSGSTASLAEIQKALNAWAGAHAGHKLKAKANPKTTKAKKARLTIARRKKTVKAPARRKARKNPGIKALGSAIVGIDNPRKKSSRRKKKAAANTFTTKRSRKTSARRKSRKAIAVASQVKRRKSRKSAAKVHHNPRTRRASSTKRKSSVKKHRKSGAKRKSTRKTRRNPVESIAMVPMGYALMHNNPYAGLHGSRHHMRNNPEVSTGVKLGYGVLGASMFLTGSNLVGGLVQGHLISAEAKADTKSHTPMIAEVLTHVALGGVAYHVYKAAPRDESIKAFAIGSALGVVGSLVARTVAKEAVANSFLGKFFRATGGQGEFTKTIAGYVPDHPTVGRYIETPGVVAGYVPDHPTVGSYITKPVGSYITKPVHGYVPDHPTVGKFIAESPLETMSGLGRYIEVGQPQGEQQIKLEGMNMRHLHGLRDTDMGTQVLSSRNAPQDLSRTGGRGFDLAQLSQELRDVDSLSFEELRAEGVPEVNLETVAVIRATPYYARQIVESNLGYMMSESVIVPGSYLVGLFVGPDSMMYNTGIGARNLSIPHGVRSARPAGIFTHTVFSSILPTADGQPIWAGGDDGDL